MHVKLSNLVMINFSVSIFDGCIPKMTPVLSNKEQNLHNLIAILKTCLVKVKIHFVVLLHSRVLEGNFYGLKIKRPMGHNSQMRNSSYQ